MSDIIVTAPASIVVQAGQTGKTQVIIPTTGLDQTARTTANAALAAAAAAQDANGFSTINVAGQSNIVATTATSTLKFVEGAGILLTTDSTNSSLSITATGGAAFDQFARDHANGAFAQANTANVTGQAAFDKANSSNTLGQSAFNQANTANVTGQAAFDKANGAIYTAAQIRSNVSNTAPINYDASTGIISHADSSVTPATYGNTTFVPTITVDAKGHVTSITNTAIALPSGIDQFARDHANGAFTQANTGNDVAHLAWTQANAAYDFAVNTAIYAFGGLHIEGSEVISAYAPNSQLYIRGENGVSVTANSNSNTITFSGNTIWDVANSAYALAQSSFTKANSTVQNSFTIISVNTQNNVVADSNNDILTLISGTGIVITTDATNDTITIAATGGSSLDQFARDQANAAFNEANTANSTAQAAFDKANTSNVLSVAGKTGVVSLDTYDIAENVSSNLWFTRARVRANVSNTAPINYDGSTGVFSHADSGVSLGTYGSSTQVPVVTVDAKGHITSVANATITVAATTNSFVTINVAGQANVVADSNTDTLTLVAGTYTSITTDAPNDTITIASTGDQFARDHSNGAFNQANTANVTGQAAFDKANTANVTGQAAFDKANGAIYTAAQIRSNVSNTTPIDYDASTGVISHADSGAVATGYGDAANVPAFVVTAKGHITSVSNTPISINASQVTSGTLLTSRGGTGQSTYANGDLLIGNGTTGGLARANLTAGYGILITNGEGTIRLDSAFGKSYYFNITNTADVVGYHTAPTTPSPNPENTTITLCTTAGVFNLIASFITDVGEPGTTLLPAGTYLRHMYGTTDGASSIGQLRVELYKRASNGTETLLRTNDSPNFSSSDTQAILLWSLTDSNGYVLDSTDRLVFKLYASRVSGGSGSINVTIYYEGNSRATSITTSILSPTADQFARTTANAAFAKANTANVTGQAAFDKANGAIYTAAQIRSNVSNTAPINYDASTGVISHADSGAVAATYGNTTFVPTITVDAKGHITSITNTAIALPSGTDQFARDTANGAFTKANGAIYTAAQIRANISNTAPINYDASTGIISHADSGAVATGYGDAATLPKVVVDARGHVTSVTNTSIAIAASQVTSGTLVVARGGTGQTAPTVNGSVLIGNTVSGGYDLNSLTAGSGISVTNDKGSITIAVTGGSSIDQYARDKANGAVQTGFPTINVAGNNNIVATSNSATLVLANGKGIVITTNSVTNTITFTITAGALGGSSDQIFYENGKNVTANYTITSGKNAMTAGPLAIDTGIIVTVPSGSTWTVV